MLNRIHGINNSITYELAAANNFTILSQEFTSRVFRSSGDEVDKELVNDLLKSCTDDTGLTKMEQSIANYYSQT